MLKKVFFVNHAPKEFHNLLMVFVITGMLLTTFFLFNGRTKEYKSLTVERNEKLFKTAYKLFTKGGYYRSEADFDSLLKVNTDAVKDLIMFAKEENITIDTRDFDLGFFDYSYEGYSEEFKMNLGLPFKYYNWVPNWKGRFLAFALCWGGIILTLLFTNFTLKPIANKYKYFWIFPYLISVIVPLFFGFVIGFDLVN